MWTMMMLRRGRRLLSIRTMDTSISITGRTGLGNDPLVGDFGLFRGFKTSLVFMAFCFCILVFGWVARLYTG
jgi:hypothetical protein